MVVELSKKGGMVMDEFEREFVIRIYSDGRSILVSVKESYLEFLDSLEIIRYEIVKVW